jgi:hypothetical protein
MPTIYFESMRPDLDIPQPTPSIHALPVWWKSMDRYVMHSFEKIPTIKNCPGIIDIMYSGYTLYLPTNIYIDASQPYIQYDFDNFGLKKQDFANFMLRGHLRKQTEKYVAAQDFHLDVIKINTFWGIKTDKGYSTMFFHPWHRMDLPFYTSPAIVDTDDFPARDKYNFHFKKDFVGMVPKGTPILQMFPYKRQEWESKIVELDIKNMQQTFINLKKTVLNSYKKNYWKRKKYT